MHWRFRSSSDQILTVLEISFTILLKHPAGVTVLSTEIHSLMRHVRSHGHTFNKRVRFFADAKRCKNSLANF